MNLGQQYIQYKEREREGLFSWLQEQGWVKASNEQRTGEIIHAWFKKLPENDAIIAHLYASTPSDLINTGTADIDPLMFQVAITGKITSIRWVTIKVSNLAEPQLKERLEAELKISLASWGFWKDAIAGGTKDGCS